ncbi:cytochrome P450 [Vannielia litorea]|uniref:cytochrome P450 n=1 Tax=Vannielia litorea TaxID=1217970 RepID=UPI001C95E84D|nr:cytochrome P450 [Vannielia litorea]MBY6155297.1 cytochrome P450 [Vannielia litorea]
MSDTATDVQAAGKPVPVDETITLEALSRDPYPIYERLRRETPVVRVPKMNRILLTKWADTKYVKDNPQIFSSNDPITPMHRAFRAHTLMRKDGEAHKCERMAMQGAFSPKVITQDWVPRYQQVAEEYLDRLPKGEVVDLFPMLAAPYAARGLAVLLGTEEASDEEMIRWSQSLIDGAGNFGEDEAIFARSEAANDEMDALFTRIEARHKENPNNSAFSVMLNAENPIPLSQIWANIKIAIGGGINEPRDALCTILCGLLTNPDQLEQVKANGDWVKAFEEGVRWVAPISVSGRYVLEDTVIRGFHIPAKSTVMTCQASANWDEEVFEDGHLFNVYRKDNPHQSFGNGPHFCQGTHVARRAVGQVMLPMIFEKYPNIQLAEPEDVRWGGWGFRGPLNLPVVLG